MIYSVNKQPNPTQNRTLNNIETKYNVVRSTSSDLSNLEILCTRCTIFDKNDSGIIVKKVLMRHDTRNELHKCPICNDTYSDNQIRYAMKLELPEYIHYNKKLTNVKDLNKEREEHERFVIEPINSQSPGDLSKRNPIKSISGGRNKPIDKLDDILRK